MNPSNIPNRREFIASVAGTTCLIAGRALGGQGRTGFNVEGEQVRGMAVSPGGQIAIAADRQVDLYDLTGRRLDRRAVEGVVRAVAFGPRERLYAALKETVASSDGCCFEVLPARLGRAAVLTGLAVDDAGCVYAADSGNNVVWKLSAEGEMLGRISPGKQPFAVSKSFFPIAWSAGRLLVGEAGRHRVLAFGADGDLLGEWGKPSRSMEGFGGCCNPVGLAATNNGFVTAERGLVRVKRFDVARGGVSLLAGPDDFTSTAANASRGCENGGVDVGLLPDGKVLVLERNARRINVFA
jgi:hypothetical protein